MKILFVISYILLIGCTNTSPKAEVTNEKEENLKQINRLSLPKQYTHEQLLQTNNQVWKKLDQLKGTSVANNVIGGGVGVYFVEINLRRNTSEKQKEFRQKVMDSPMICFSGPVVDPIDNSVGVNDTMGIYLYPEYSVYSTQVTQIKLILHNHSGTTVKYGAGYSITYPSGAGIWYELPSQGAVVDMLYHTPHKDSSIFIAYLYPDVNNNRAGCYRYFHDIRVGNRKLRLMAEFRLSDKEQEWKNAKKTVIPEEYQKDFLLFQDKIFNMVEERPQFPGGIDKLNSFIRRNLPKNISKKGRVIVKFIIEKDGKADHIEIAHSSDNELNQEAIRIVNKMPRWLPGKMNGHPVRVSFTIPISFNEVGKDERN